MRSVYHSVGIKRHGVSFLWLVKPIEHVLEAIHLAGGEWREIGCCYLRHIIFRVRGFVAGDKIFRAVQNPAGAKFPPNPFSALCPHRSKACR